MKNYIFQPAVSETVTSRARIWYAKPAFMENHVVSLLEDGKRLVLRGQQMSVGERYFVIFKDRYRSLLKAKSEVINLLKDMLAHAKIL